VLSAARCKRTSYVQVLVGRVGSWNNSGRVRALLGYSSSSMSVLEVSMTGAMLSVVSMATNQGTVCTRHY
jgi:hypothetical protein